MTYTYAIDETRWPIRGCRLLAALLKRDRFPSIVVRYLINVLLMIGYGVLVIMCIKRCAERRGSDRIASKLLQGFFGAPIESLCKNGISLLH